MKTLFDPVEIVRKEIETWNSPFVELDCFGTNAAERIVGITNEFCLSYLQSSILGSFFYRASVGSVHGIRLEDGRDVVIKVRPPPETNPDLSFNRESLGGICLVMNWLAHGNYPCPKVLFGPTPLARGLATVEEFLDRGGHGNGFEPECRKIIAAGFAELIDRLRSFKSALARLKHFRRGNLLYPQPHSKLFDFNKTADGAEWIDEFARRARQLETNAGSTLLGHADWRVEHLRFEDSRIVATYDWDSLAAWPETELVANSAYAFTADWTLDNVRRIPTAEDIHAYVMDYEQARGWSFSIAERRSLFAHCVYAIAYSARCAHALQSSKLEWEPNTWPYLLRTEGSDLLREANS